MNQDEFDKKLQEAFDLLIKQEMQELEKAIEMQADNTEAECK